MRRGWPWQQQRLRRERRRGCGESDNAAAIRVSSAERAYSESTPPRFSRKTTHKGLGCLSPLPLPSGWLWVGLVAASPILNARRRAQLADCFAFTRGVPDVVTGGWEAGMTTRLPSPPPLVPPPPSNLLAFPRNQKTPGANCLDGTFAMPPGDSSRLRNDRLQRSLYWCMLYRLSVYVVVFHAADPSPALLIIPCLLYVIALVPLVPLNPSPRPPRPHRPPRPPRHHRHHRPPHRLLHRPCRPAARGRRAEALRLIDCPCPLRRQ